MALPSASYRSKFQTIARYVDFTLPRRLTPAVKAKITRYHNRIGKALERGYKVVKAKNDGRIEKAHRAQGIRGMPALRVVLVKPVGAGYRVTINPDGSIRSTNPVNGISKVTIGAQFFDAEEVEEGEPEEEAARLMRMQGG